MINQKKNDFAPILLIAFNRPNHFYHTLIALCNNRFADKSDLYISIDGPLTENDKKSQQLIYEYLKIAKNYFAKVILIKNKVNKGLAENITQSISYVLKDHKKIIVVEDDLITSKSFLNFMNDALDFYEDKKKVWHINGHNIISNKDKKDAIFLWRFMNCWGWATWRDRWLNFEMNPDFFIESFNDEMIYKFNLDGIANFWEQVILNSEGKKKTWAIFWYATIFLNDGICVSPWFSFVQNIGFDGSGVNCEKGLSKKKSEEINHLGKFIGLSNLVEDKKAFKIMQKEYSKPFLKVLITKILKRTLGKSRYIILKNFLIRFI